MAHWQDEFLNLLREYYQKQKRKNPRYSMRALARNLNIAPGPASALIKGSKVWNISEDWALRVLAKMNLKPTERKRILALMKFHSSTTQTKPIEDLSGLAVEHWAYWPILCCFDVPDLADSPQKISKKLGIKKADVDTIVQDLLRRRFLIKSTDGSIKRPSEYLATTDDISSETIRLLHKSNLDLAKKALEKFPVLQREFQTITVAGSSEAVQEIKKEIRDFTDRLAHILNRDQGNDQVFRLSVQLFPMELGDFDVR